MCTTLPEDCEEQLNDLENSEFQSKVNDFLRILNHNVELFCIVLNFVHLVFLFSKPLRTNPVFILMIEICIFEMIYFGQYFIQRNYNLVLETTVYCLELSLVPAYPYRFAWDLVSNLSRRMFVWLMVQLASVRTFSICFPMSNWPTKHRNTFACSFLLFLFWLIVHGWYMLFARSYRMKEHLEYRGCKPNTPDDWDKPLPTYVIALPTAYGLYYTRALDDAEGYIRIFTAIVYSILVVIMIVKLRMISRKRRSLNSKESEKSDHTTMLVILMTLTFLISEGYPAVLALYLIYIRNSYTYSYNPYLTFFGYILYNPAPYRKLRIEESNVPNVLQHIEP
uniref:G_PROTEIN_RECEP_F1_2 domain-containing protein n=1 Tax=Caenorhabditis tropicalis TaxID=1561998 RepID=A0A1I7T7M9_9PELO